MNKIAVAQRLVHEFHLLSPGFGPAMMPIVEIDLWASLISYVYVCVLIFSLIFSLVFLRFKHAPPMETSLELMGLACSTPF